MAPQSRIRCVTTLGEHCDTNGARRRRPIKQSVRAIRGAGQFRRRPAERPRHFRGGPHAQGLGRVERSVPPDADRAHEFGAAPASSRTARQLLVDAARGAGRVRRRPAERPLRVRVERPPAQGVGRDERRVPPDADRAYLASAAPASSRHNAFDRSRRRWAQVTCVVALSDGHVVSGSDDDTLKVWDVSSGLCLRTLTRRTNNSARRRRPVEPRGRSLVDARGAGRLRQRPRERPRRVRVERLDAQGVGRFDR